MSHLEWLYHFDPCTKERKGGSNTRLLILDGHRWYLEGNILETLQCSMPASYTRKNIASTIRATGICPFNPDAVTRLITGDINPATVPTSTVATSSKPDVDIFFQLKTPRKSRNVRQQPQLAVEALPQTGDVNVANPVVERYGHTTQTALATAEIRGIELADVRRLYGGKKAEVTNRWVISKARVINGADLIRKMDERQKVDQLMEENDLCKLALGKLRVPSSGKKPKVCFKYLLLILVI